MPNDSTGFFKSLRKFFQGGRPEELESHEIYQQYFSRCRTWYWLDTTYIVVNDPAQAWVITMGPWPQIIFLDADGQRTLGQYAQDLETHYPHPPARLRRQIRELLESLVEDGVIRLHGEPEILPEYFAEDITAKPSEVRAEQLRRDGLIS